MATYTMLVSGIVMIIYGLYLQMNRPEAIAILFLVFGPFSIFQARGDLSVYRGKKEIEKMHWFLGHAGKMIGAYSAAVTAFCVNIVPRYMPEGSPVLAYIMVWVLPGVLFGLVSAYTIKRYRRMFSDKKPSLKSKVALA
jgi:uncharacterized membrane protein HdeD (DUF308 family)